MFTFSGGPVSTLEDTPILISGVYANDPDGDDLTVFIDAKPSSGKFTQADGKPINAYPAAITDSQLDFIYIPAPDANGPVTFAVFVSDGTVSTDPPATATITVIPVDDSPVAGTTTVSIDEDKGTTLITAPYSDVDSSPSSISMTVLSLPSSAVGTLQRTNGTAVSVGDVITSLEVNFVNAPYSYGNTSFLFNVKDDTSYSNVGVVYINISHVNHVPTAVCLTSPLLCFQFI